jgi:hypothetical protein
MENENEIKGPDVRDAARDYANEEITAPQISSFLTGYAQATREGLGGFIRTPPKNYPFIWNQS